jgi:hypothetical protein
MAWINSSLHYFEAHGFLDNYKNIIIVEKIVDLRNEKHCDKMEYILKIREFTQEDFLKIVNDSINCCDFLDLISKRINKNDFNNFLEQVIAIVSKRTHCECDGYEENVDCIFYATKRLNLNISKILRKFLDSQDYKEYVDDFRKDHKKIVNNMKKYNCTESSSTIDN